MGIQALFIIGMILLVVLGLFVIPRILIKRAISQVIFIFRRSQATSTNQAKTIDELGLKPRSFLEGMLKTRDYKPYALDMLRQQEIVRMTPEGRLYLSEEKLSSTGLENRARRYSRRY